MRDRADLDRPENIDDVAGFHAQARTQRVAPRARCHVAENDDPPWRVTGAARAADALEDDRHRVQQVRFSVAEQGDVLLNWSGDVNVERIELHAVEDLAR